VSPRQREASAATESKVVTASRRPYFSIVPTARFAYAIAAVAPLWLLPGRGGATIALASLAVILLVAAGDYVALPGKSDLELERDLPPTVGIGDRAVGTYVVRSRWRRPLGATLVETGSRAVRRSSEYAPFAIPAGGSVEVPLEIEGMIRGRHELGTVGLRVTAAAGLVARRLVFAPDDTVLVTPSVSSVRRFRLLALQHRLLEAGVRLMRRRGEGQAFAAMREYVRGDDPRHIDWKTSGKRAKLITREYTVEQSQTVFTLIDAGRSMTQLAGEFSRFEHALSAALVLTDTAATSGDYVGSLVFDDEVRAFVPAHRGRSALRAVRDALIPVEATLAEPDYAAAFRLLAARQRKRALVVFFTDVIDVRASRTLLAQLTRGAVRHLVLIVALKNDALVAASRRGEGKLGPYTAAAAEELLSARAEALERMRRLGAIVLDVSPSAMTAAVVNRYLEIKARGML
jgi:uncharacterized protein (DUF58 family)